MRDPNRIDKFCDELKTIWHKVPDWRLSQLMKNALNEWINLYGTDPFYAEDPEFMEFIKSFIEETTIENN